MVSCRLRWRDRPAEIPEIQNINWVRAKRGGEGAGLCILGSDSGLVGSFSRPRSWSKLQDSASASQLRAC